MNMTKTIRGALAAAGLCACIAPLGACGSRPAYWDEGVSVDSVSYGLAKGVALVDDADHRVHILTVPDGSLEPRMQSLLIGHGVVSVTVSPDRKRLFVLSAGDWPRRTTADEAPSMTMIDFGPTDDGWVAQAHAFPMTEPRGNLALDPQGAWAVAYAGGATGSSGQASAAASASFVLNPNEIVLFDLSPMAATPVVPRTLQSFGGTPQRLYFTPELGMPPGATPATRRLLLIETEIDVTMLDLDRAFEPSPPPEITVPLTSRTNTAQVRTAGLAIDGRSTDPNDARFAVWTSNDTNVYTLQLVAPTTDKRNAFSPTINLTDVGGIPSQVAFVQTEDPTSPTGISLRVAALVPSQSSAVLVDPDRSLTVPVTLPVAYASMSLVTNLVAGTPGNPDDGTDVALLWNGSTSANGAALWTLTNAMTQPYASIATLGVTQPIAHTLDVPAPNQRLKVLEMQSGSGFYVLDLSAPTAPPLSTASQATLSIAPDGGRLWAFAPGGTNLAAVDLRSLNPVPLTTDLGIAAVYDIQRPDNGRALVAVHEAGGLGVTVFDALTPVTATSRRVAPLLLEGP
jgi:hypothetical protein